MARARLTKPSAARDCADLFEVIEQGHDIGGDDVGIGSVKVAEVVTCRR